MTTDDPRQHLPLRVFISGSCVSRDTFQFLDPAAFELADYVARQSLISAFSPATSEPPDAAAMPSPFQRRMLLSDAASQLPAVVAAEAATTDLLLWDLVDERLGVFEHADGGWSTDSVELRAVRAVSGPPSGQAVHHPVGTPVHREMFAAALVRWRDLLLETGLRDRTLLLAPPWAEQTVAGDPTPPSFGLEARQANGLFHEYVEEAADVVGVKVVAHDDVRVRADADHKWGLAAFHYDDQSYLRLARELVDETATMRTGRLSGPTSGPALPLRATSMRHRDAGPSVTLHESGEPVITATVHGSSGTAFAFHLFSGRTALSKQHYGPIAHRTFDVADHGKGPFHVRAFVIDEAKQRTTMVSPRIRLR